MRPTSDRLRETLFNVIAPRIEGARFLDLCAGSGAVGIEALSRGASHSTFIDRARKMVALIEANLDQCRIAKEESRVILSEAADFLHLVLRQGGKPSSRGNGEPWDIVFFDPPYATDYLPTLETLGTLTSSLLTEDALVIVEHHHKKELPDALGNLHRFRTLKQGDSALSFYKVE